LLQRPEIVYQNDKMELSSVCCHIDISPVFFFAFQDPACKLQIDLPAGPTLDWNDCR